MYRPTRALLAVTVACILANVGALLANRPECVRHSAAKPSALRRSAVPRQIEGFSSTGAPVEAHVVGTGGVMALRGGAGLAKKVGAKNIGLLTILLSLLFVPYAMGSCSARLGRDMKIQRLGCGPQLAITNIFTLAGISLVLANSRSFDRHGRSKFKMRLTGSIIIGLGMFLIIAHAEAARVSWYAKSNAYLGLLLEWWGFISLFYNFTPRLVAQIPREVTKLMGKLTGKAGGAAAAGGAAGGTGQAAQQAELDRLNRWAAEHDQAT